MLAGGEVLISSAVSGHVICVASSSSSPGATASGESWDWCVRGSDSVRDLAADLDGVCGPALWDQRSTRFRLTVEEGVAGKR